MSLLASSTA